VERPSITVVVATRDRRETLLGTLGRLAALRDAPAVIVVDDGSRDGTAAAVAATHPEVELIVLPESAGVGARNAGARAAATPLIAFCDDDSWWAEGALARAADRFARDPALGLVAARILVGPGERLDPTSAAMARGPWPAGAAGPAVAGFLACGVVLRRAAFLAAGGFEERFGLGGEEALLAMDLAVAGWSMVYADDVVAHHHPPSAAPRAARRRATVRNDLWTAWLRRPVAPAARVTLAALRPSALPALLDAITGMGWVMRERRPLPAAVERSLRAVRRTGVAPRAGKASRARRARPEARRSRRPSP
jgi:GT2 family glycosyltransferase